MLPASPSLPSVSRPAAAPASAPAVAGNAALVEAAVQFEGMFIAQMFQAMRQAGEAWGEGQGEDPSAGLLEHAYRLVADEIAGQRAFGIADSLIAQMNAQTIATTAPASPDGNPE